MAIDFACGNCGKWFHLKDDMAGLRGRCSGCGDVMQIPGNTPGATSRPAAPMSSASDLSYDIQDDDELLPPRAPMTTRPRARRTVTSTRPDFQEVVDWATPQWFGTFLKGAGSLLVFGGIIAEACHASGTPVLPGVDGQVIGFLSIAVGVVLFLSGVFIRQLTMIYIVARVTAFYIRAFCFLLAVGILLFCLVTGVRLRPRNRPGIARPPVAQWAPPPPAPVFAPRLVPVAGNPNPAPGPVAVAPQPPVFSPFPPPPDFTAQAKAHDDAVKAHQKSVNEMFERHKQIQAEMQERHERMREEMRKRNEQMRARLRLP